MMAKSKIPYTAIDEILTSVAHIPFPKHIEEAIQNIKAYQDTLEQEAEKEYRDWQELWKNVPNIDNLAE